MRTTIKTEFDRSAVFNALRSIALYEAGKGALILVTGLGLLSLLHHDIQHFAARLLLHLHLNPAARYPHIFLDAASQLTEPRMLAAGAAAYSTVRLVESCGGDEAGRNGLQRSAEAFIFRLNFTNCKRALLCSASVPC